MTGLPQNVSIFLYTQAVDFRKGFDGLTGIVTAALGRRVTDGSLFLFVNRKRDRIKALWWETGGLTLWYRRLEQGTVELPSAEGDQSHVTIDSVELAMWLAGVSLKQSQLDDQAGELSLKSKLIEEQAHSVLQLKANNDRLDEKVTELNLKIAKLLQQLYGRRSERRIDGAGQLLLDLGEEATPEVVSALEEAIRDAEEIVEDAEHKKKDRRRNRPRRDDRKFPEHLPRYERIVDLPKTNVKD